MREALGGLGLERVIPSLADRRSKSDGGRGDPQRHWAELLGDRLRSRHSRISGIKATLNRLRRTNLADEQGPIRRVVKAQPVGGKIRLVQRVRGNLIQEGRGP